MKNREMKFPQDIYFQYLGTINGVSFTHREIDAIAFIVSGRTTKKIAYFLSISPKTVDNHIHNIMMKLECHSRESIIDFVEKSGKFSILRQYYLSSLIKFSFKKKLEEISRLRDKAVPTCLLVSCGEEEKQDLTLGRLIRHLKLAGIKTSITSKQQYETLTSTSKNTPAHTLFIMPGMQLKELSILTEEREEESNDDEFSPIFKLTKDIRERPSAFTFVLLNRDVAIDIPKAISDRDYVEFREQENYYFSALNLLKRIRPDLNFDKIISEFTRDCSLVYDSSDKTDFQAWSKVQKVLQQETLYNIVLYFFRNEKRWKILVLTFCVGILYILFLIFNNNGLHKTMVQSVRSDLIVPSEPTMLDRPELLSTIEEGFKGAEPLKTVALVGIAGAGKTTIARQYARLQNSSVIWEINAETKEALIGSFESLAQALSKTEDDQRILRGLQEIKESKEREEKILQFVKDRLKLHKDWILIYDNVEKFADFQKHFPQDNGTWGDGKVIVTTRDSNIQNVRTITQIVQVKELDQAQKLSLFMKILNHGVNHPWTQVQKEEATTFLKAIPPFPLDISVAAYYIKSTHVPYKKYLKRLADHRKDFIDVQENILKNANDYPKARYSIITLSLNQLMELNKDFPYLLLFISLLDSQNIPRNLLETRMNEVSVDDFIFNLKKYSLVTNHSLTTYPWGATFSIHRSTQEISLAHLMERLTLKPNHPWVQLISQNLENYIHQLIEKEDLFQLRLLVSHCEMFLSHHQLLTEELRSSLFGELGGIHTYLGNYSKAKQFLEDGLKLHHKDRDDHKNQDERARALAYLGNVYGDLGDYEKAKGLLEQSLAIYEKHFSDNHAGVAWTLTYLGNVYRDLGEHEKAKDLLERSLHIYKTYFPENYTGNARASAYLGIIYTILGEYEKAKNLLEQSLLIYQNHLSPNHVGVAWVSAHLGNAYGELGDYEKARDLLERSIALYKEHFPEDHIKVGWALSYLGDVYRITGDYEKAKKALEKSILIYKKHLSENHIVIAGILVYLSDVYKDLRDYEKAKDLLEESLLIYKKHFPENHNEVAWALAHLGDIYRIMGNFEKAQALLEQSLTIYRQHFSEDHNEVVWASKRLKHAYDKVSDYKKDQE